MIGIDIVDHADSLIRPRNPTHLRFIHHPEDLSLDETDYWDFWTAKEAVFKAKRISGNFDPRHIPVQFQAVKKNNNLFTSTQSINGFTKRTDEFSLAVAYNNERNTYFQILKSGTQNPSQEIRKLFQKWYIETFGTEVVVINDKHGLPYLQGSKDELSFSHHGKYLAFGLKKS